MFRYTTQPTQSKCSVGCEHIDLVLMTDEILSSYESLDSSIKELDQVQCLMNNVHASIEYLHQFGKDAIPTLNIDKGLEELLCLPENLISAEKAVEELEHQNKSLWQRFVDWIKKIISSVREFFSKLFTFRKSKVEDVEKVSNAPDDKVANAAVDEVLSRIDDGLNELHKVKSDFLSNHDARMKQVDDNFDRIMKQVDILFNEEADAETRLTAMNRIGDSVIPGISKMHEELDSIDWDAVRKNLGVVSDKSREADERLKAVNADLNDLLEDLTDGSTESINIHISDNGNKIGQLAKKRSKSSKLKQLTEESNKFNQAVIKFHSDVEIKIKELENDQETLNKVQDRLRKIERVIAEISRLDVALVRQATFLTSRIARRVK